MSFIEGVGDEVTTFFVIFLAFVLAALVTLINNRPLHTIRTRFHVHTTGSETQTIILTPEIYRSSTVRHRQNQSSRSSQLQQTDTGTNEAASSNIEGNHVEEVTSSNTHRTVQEETSQPDSTVSGVSAKTSVAENSSTEENTVDSVATELGDDVPSGEQTSNSADSAQSNHREGEIQVRLKYLDDTEKTVMTTLDTNIGDFKQTHFSEDIRNNKIVRLIFAGHLLQNSSTIQSCRIVNNSVVHVQVLAAPTPQSTPAPSQDNDLAVGRFLWPVITIIIGLCWMTYFKYPEYYNSMSLGMLLLFSGCFFYFLSQTNQ